MSTRGRVAARASLSVAAVAMLSGGCAALDGFQHATTLTFRVDTLECGAAKASSTVCTFFAYYGNVSKKPIQVDPGSTKVVDRKGNVLQPVADKGAGDSFLLKPGLQHPVAWTVTLPATAKPAKVTWHGTSVPVLLDVAPLPSASAVPSTTPVPSATPSAPASSAAPSTAAPTTVAPTTTAPTTTRPKPTTTKPKPKPTTPKPTTAKPTTKPPVTTPPPPPPTTTRPPVIHHTTQPPTTNPSNPGGGSGGIG